MTRTLEIAICVLVMAGCSAIGGSPSPTEGPAQTLGVTTKPTSETLPTAPADLAAAIQPVAVQTIVLDGRSFVLPSASRWTIGPDRGATALDPGSLLIDEVDRSAYLTLEIPDGERRLYGESIWLIQNGKTVTVADGARYLDSNGQTLLLWSLVGDQAELRLVDLRGNWIASLPGSGTIVGTFDGTAVMVADKGKFGRWDVVSGKVDWHNLPDDFASPEAVWVTGERAVVVSVIGQVLLLDTSLGTVVSMWFAGGSSRIATDPTGEFVASSSGDAQGIVEVRRISDGSIAQKMQSALSNVGQLAWPTDGLIWYLSAPTGTGSIVTLMLRTPAGGEPAEVATGTTDLVSLGAGKDSLAVVGADGTVTQFDLTGIEK